MSMQDLGCGWCEGFWDAWATFCPTHEGSPLLSEAEQFARLGVGSFDELWEDGGC